MIPKHDSTKLADVNNSSVIKRIFYPVINVKCDLFKSSSSSKKSKAFSIGSFESISDPDKSLLAEWEELILLFPSLESLDSKSILLYSDPNVDEKFSKASKHFSNIISEFDYSFPNMSVELLNDNLLKIFVISFQYCTHQLLEHILENIVLPSEKAQEMLKILFSLSQFLVLTLDNRKSPVIVNQHYISIQIIINENLAALHKNFNGNFKDTAFISQFICCQFLTLGVLIAFNEGRTFMKNAATDFIKSSFDILELFTKDSLVNSLLTEVYKYPVGRGESWISLGPEHVKAAFSFKRKKFSIIHLGFEHPKYSASYLGLYYILKVLRLLDIESTAPVKEKLLELVSIIFKRSLKFFQNKVPSMRFPLGDEITEYEIHLNESLICFNIMKRILPCVDDPLYLLDKWGYNSCLKPFIDFYILFVIRFKLVAFVGSHQIMGELCQDIASYKTSRDYISGVFNFLNKLKNSKAIYKYKVSILNLLEEIIGQIIAEIDSFEKAEAELKFFKAYLVEYLFDNRHVMSRQMAEYVVKLVESKSFHFTAPKILEQFEEANDPIENITNEKIVLILKEIMESDKAWALTIIQHLIGMIPNLIRNKEELFGLYKLIYCGLRGKVYDNIAIFNLLFSKEMKSIDCSLYKEYEAKEESKVRKSFIDIKGMQEIMNILLKYFNECPEDDKSLIMTENFFLELVKVLPISEQLLKQPLTIIEFLEYSYKGSHQLKVAVNFMKMLFSILKYDSKFAGNTVYDKRNYLPLTLTHYISHRISGNKKNIQHLLPFVEIIVDFLIEEPKSPLLELHQKIMERKVNLNTIYEILKLSAGMPFIGEILKLLLAFLKGVQWHNDDVACNISNSSLIKHKGLSHFLKSEIKNPSDVNNILQILLNIAFEADVDLLKPSKLLIKRHRFLLIYLTLIAFLSKLPDWYEVTAIHCKVFHESICNSYWNYSICQKSYIFKEVLKIENRHLKNPEIFRLFMRFCTDIMSLNASSNSLKSLIGMIKDSIEQTCYETLCNSILSLLALSLNTKPFREVFVFTGKSNSGIELLTIKELPRDGFCFCSAIRLERNDDKTKAMTVFKLVAGKKLEMELFVKDGHFNYAVKNPVKKNESVTIEFTQMEVEEDKWYFIELYHINTELAKNLLFYVNSELIQEAYIRKYSNKLNYDENTIGCGIKYGIFDKLSEECIIDNLLGEMSAVYFFEVNNKNHLQTHTTLEHIVKNSMLEDLLDYILSIKQNKSRNKLDNSLIERLFMQVNPKYTNKNFQSKQRVFLIKTPKEIELYNSVERVYKDTKICHNLSVNDTFINNGGIKMILPILHNVIENNPNVIFAYLF